MNRYAIALGSNRGHGTARTPKAMIDQAVAAIAATGVAVERLSTISETLPLGPSRRRFANSAAVIATPLEPLALLGVLKQIERALGRRRGQRWGERAIDIDIILWSGGRWGTRMLTIPHPQWRKRAFVLRPLAMIAPDWREPISGRSVRQIAHSQSASRDRRKFT